MAQSKVLGILGGMGPMATVYFYELVTAHTKVAKDQDHIDMVISSKATTPDRTKYILGKSDEDPFVIMEADAQRLVVFGAEVIAVPCNTAHYFYKRLHKVIPVPVLNMVGDTVRQEKEKGRTKVGILATDGTIETRTYQRVCEEQGLDYMVPDEAGQQLIMSIIYDDIKKNKPPTMEHFFTAVEPLWQAGCQSLILGCTELSLLKKTGQLDSRYIDSMEVLAKSAIKACGKTPVGFNE